MNGRPSQTGAPYRERLAAMWEAERLGRTCGHCGRSLAPGEPVTLCAWETVRSYGWVHRLLAGSAPVCDGCLALGHKERGIEFRRTEGRPVERPCGACGRPLRLGWSARRRHAYCSRACYGALLRRMRRMAGTRGAPVTPDV